MVNIIRYVAPVTLFGSLFAIKGSKRPNRVVGPAHHGKRASGSTAGVRGQITVLLPYNCVF
jgi:hypothetical protein